MTGIFETARQLQAFCDERSWSSCFIGGIAVQRWGEPRVTRDVDVTLLTGYGGEDAFIDALLAEYPGRIDGAGEFARKRRVLLLSGAGGVGIDISLGALPFEERMVSRASAFLIAPGLELRTCSAEDLVVMKLFAGRPLDIRDAESVVIRNQKQLDWAYIEEQLAPLAEVKGDAGIVREVQRLRG